MKTVDALAEILRREGVDFLFCFPTTPIIEACARAGIRPVITRMERTLVNMADGYTRVNNGLRNGVCAVQYGPGIENAFPGVAQAYADGVPVLVLPLAVESHQLRVPPNFSAPENYRGITKWVDTINRPDRLPEMLRRAFKYLRTGRPGPVVLEIPIGVATAELTTTPLDYAPVRRHRTMGDPADVARAAEAIVAAQQPLLIAGHGVLYAGASAVLVELAELVDAAVGTTILGKSAFPEDHPIGIKLRRHSRATRAIGRWRDV
jgi:thiamine pyrophosphate-dependent acetolactate synthase large subunit-like protein